MGFYLVAELRKMLDCRETEKETEDQRGRKGNEALPQTKAGVKWELPAFLGLDSGPHCGVLGVL